MLGKLTKSVLVVFVLLAGVAGGVAYYLSTNIHAVIPGQVYRSAQLSPERMSRFVLQHGIHSILNLRGSNAGRRWYQQELALSQRLHVVHYDVRLAKYVKPSPATLAKLVGVLQRAKRPLLLHCMSGSDRSGFAAAVVLLLDNKSVSIAREQISWKYFSATSGTLGPQVLAAYQRWLRVHRMARSTAGHFLHWVKAISA